MISCSHWGMFEGPIVFTGIGSPGAVQAPLANATNLPPYIPSDALSGRVIFTGKTIGTGVPDAAKADRDTRALFADCWQRFDFGKLD